MLAEKIGLNTQASSSPDAKAMVQALEALAAQGTVANMITDPVAWQRETRQDRKLPYRDDHLQKQT